MGEYEDLRERDTERRKAIAAGASGAAGLLINLGENARLAPLRGKYAPPPDWWSGVFGIGSFFCFTFAFLLFASGGWDAPWPTKRMPLTLCLLGFFACYLAIFGWGLPISAQD